MRGGRRVIKGGGLLKVALGQDGRKETKRFVGGSYNKASPYHSMYQPPPGAKKVVNPCEYEQKDPRMTPEALKTN